jgi:hypothetical protein
MACSGVGVDRVVCHAGDADRRFAQHAQPLCGAAFAVQSTIELNAKLGDH